MQELTKKTKWGLFSNSKAGLQNPLNRPFIKLEEIGIMPQDYHKSR